MKNEKIEEDINQICSEHKLKEPELFDPPRGVTGCIFYSAKVSDQKSQPVMIKIGYEPRAKEEILANNRTYELMENLGLCEHSPFLYSGENYTVMKDLRGLLFVDIIKESKDPIQTYETLFDNLRKIYVQTLHKNKQKGKDAFTCVFGDEIQGRYFKDYLLPSGLVGDSELKKLATLQSKVSQLPLEFVAFGTGGEMKPTDLYLEDGNLIYLDLREPNYISPLIELSILSELFKVHKLPAAEKGYELTHELIEELVHQVGLAERDSGI